MPSQPPSAGAGTVRLAHVFVRLPSEHQRNVNSSASDGQKADSGENSSALKQHNVSVSKEAPITPQKTAKTFNTIQTNLPLTPEPTPTRNLKRTPTTALLDPQTPCIKRHRTHIAPSTPSPSPHRRFLRTPKFSIVYQPVPQQEEEKEAISWMELKRIAESVIEQVDWEDVAEDVASNRSAGMYKKIVRNILQERIEACLWRRSMTNVAMLADLSPGKELSEVEDSINTVGLTVVVILELLRHWRRRKL
ncbi:MAG: hypothetical protein ALECFALPRED_006735 [Alectoria fallacina]|uniref:Uncharacterized protein n=1 Tax=Alectoria fallacina TaxID=1903189 RepID=A0A8H3G5K9_9LECA|nr:MAG: hypothetical protein ALECFALPRED_006735 [Alectoria fallacina]